MGTVKKVGLIIGTLLAVVILIEVLTGGSSRDGGLIKQGFNSIIGVINDEINGASGIDNVIPEWQ